MTANWLYRGLVVLFDSGTEFQEWRRSSKSQQAATLLKMIETQRYDSDTHSYGRKGVGRHWSWDEMVAMDHASRDTFVPLTTPVVVAIDPPEEQRHIETDPDVLAEHGVLHDWEYNPEDEVTIRPGAPLHLVEIQWQERRDAPWQRQSLSGVSKTAAYFLHDVNEPLVDTKSMEGFEDKASFDWVHPLISTGGAVRRKSDMRILYRQGVRGVVSGRRDFDESVLLEGQHLPGMACLILPTPDDGEGKPTSWFKSAIGFCLPYLRRGEKVYIHCHAGMNRGPSLAYAVLRAFTGQSHEQAYDHIRSVRPAALVAYAPDADKALVELGYAKAPAKVHVDTFHTLTGSKTAYPTRMQGPDSYTVEPAVIDGRACFIVRQHGYLIAQVDSVEELADIVPIDQLSEPRNDIKASKTAALSLEAVISVAEEAMERGGLDGGPIDVPDGHADDPEYRKAMEPLEALCTKICGQSMARRVYHSPYTLSQAGNPQAMVTSAGSIVLQRRTNLMTLLHECAHVITRTREGRGGHTREFVEVARDLYAEHINQEAADTFFHLVSAHSSYKTAKTAARADSVYGKQELDALFPDGAIQTSCPWPGAYRTKSAPLYDKASVTEMLRDPGRHARVEDFDPRDLMSSQPSVTRSGVAYYLTDEYRQTGRTFADQGNVGNETPVIYVRANGQKIILTGHHRAAAALLQGRPLRGIRVEEPRGTTARRHDGDAVPVRGRADSAGQDVQREDGRAGRRGDPGRRDSRAAARLLAGGSAGAGDAGREEAGHLHPAPGGLSALAGVAGPWWHGCSSQRAEQLRRDGHFPHDYRPRIHQFGVGVYLTAKPSIAEGYMNKGGGGEVVPVKPNVHKVFTCDPSWVGMEMSLRGVGLDKEFAAYEKEADDLGDLDPEFSAYMDLLAEFLREKGYDAIYLPPQDWLVVFDPENVSLDTSRLTKAASGEVTYQVSYRKDPDGEPVGEGDAWIIAKQGETFVGALRWNAEAEPPVVMDIVVEEQYRRQGIGTRLYEEAKRHQSDLTPGDVLTPDGREFFRAVSSLKTGEWWHGCSAARAEQVEHTGHFPAEYSPAVARWGKGVYLTSNATQAKTFGAVVIPIKFDGKVFIGAREDHAMRQRLDAAGLGDRVPQGGIIWRHPEFFQTLRDEGYGALGFEGISDWMIVLDPTEAKYDASRTLTKAAGPCGGRIPGSVKARPPFGSDIYKPRPVKIDRKAGEDINDLEPDERDMVLAALKRLERGTERTIEAKRRPPLVGCFSIDVTPVIRILFYLHVDGYWHCFGVTPDHNYDEIERRMRNVASTGLTLAPRGDPMGHNMVWEARNGDGTLAGYLRFDGQSKKVRIKALEVNPAQQRQGVGSWLLMQLLDTYGREEIDPGQFTSAGAALWKEVTGETVTPSTSMTLPNNRDWRYAHRTASTYTVFVGWGARTPDDPKRGLSPDSHGRIVVVEADSDNEAILLAAQMVNGGNGATNPIVSTLPEGMVTSTEILSMEASKSAGWNMEHDIAEPYDGPMYRGVGFVVDKDQAAFILDSSKPVGQRAERAVTLLEEYREMGRGGLGRHWSTDRQIARHFALMSGTNLISEARMYEGVAISMLLTILPPDPKDYETDQRVLNQHGVGGGEKEITLRPGAKVMLNAFEWWAATNSRETHVLGGSPGRGIPREAAASNVYYRLHRRDRRWDLEPYSQEFGRVDFKRVKVGPKKKGYSCFDNPWHLWDYVMRMRWHFRDVAVFTGRRSSQRGVDNEPLVTPNGDPQRWMSWHEFVDWLRTQPMGDKPTWKQSGYPTRVSDAWGDHEAYMREVTQAYDKDEHQRLFGDAA